MNLEQKLVIIINTGLPIGLAANTAAVLALSLGAKHPELIGADIVDGSNQAHLGITTIPMPILSADDAVLSSLVQKLHGTDIELVSFSKIAQSIHSYDEYARALANTPSQDITYSGVALYGPKKQVASLTGSLQRLK